MFPARIAILVFLALAPGAASALSVTYPIEPFDFYHEYGKSRLSSFDGSLGHLTSAVLTYRLEASTNGYNFPEFCEGSEFGFPDECIQSLDVYFDAGFYDGPWSLSDRFNLVCDESSCEDTKTLTETLALSQEQVENYDPDQDFPFFWLKDYYEEGTLGSSPFSGPYFFASVTYGYYLDLPGCEASGGVPKKCQGIATTPVPASLPLLGAGIAAIGLLRRRIGSTSPL